MSSYFIAQININDPAEYAKYLDGYDDIFKRFNGRVIATDENPTILEGRWPYERTVLVRFPTKDDLLRWYDSPDYQKLADYRRKASDANIIAIDGSD